MELTITFFTDFTLVVYFILALFLILLSLLHLNGGHNHYSISKVVFLSKYLFLNFLFFINPGRRIYEDQQNYLC
jgi:hypothetical protein